MLHYNITKPITILAMHPRFFALLLFISAFAHAEEQAHTAHLNVVTTIKPVHSLATSIMHGVSHPELLLSSNQSPHHYSLRPSERRKLADADLVFWIGPGMESFMPRLINSLDRNTVTVPLIETSGLVLLALRTSDNHVNKHDDEHTHDKQHDPHIWLNTHNIEKIADEITRQLIKVDPEHKTHYETNNTILKRRVAILRKELEQLLDETEDPFLTYHDAYQYFEEEFGLNNVGSISISADIQPGAGHIRKIKQQIQQQSIRCVFYDAPVKPPLLRALLSSSHAISVALDATGMMQPAGKDNLLQTMRSLGKSFSGCLQVDGQSGD